MYAYLMILSFKKISTFFVEIKIYKTCILKITVSIIDIKIKHILGVIKTHSVLIQHFVLKDIEIVFEYKSGTLENIDEKCLLLAFKS